MIEAFRAAIIHGGISSAADALDMSQPSMSRVIAELQSLVGFQLFVKHGRTVKPTEEALALMSKVQQSFLGLEEIGRFSEQLRKQRMGRLSICAIPALGHSIMPEAISALRRDFRHVVVHLEVASSIEVARRVKSRQADIGFAASGLAFGDVETVSELSGHCVCIAASGDLPEDWKRVDIGWLAGRPFVALTGAIQKQLETAIREVGGELDVVAEVSQSLSASELVLRGLGVSVVDPFTGEMHRRRGGAVLPLEPSMTFKVQAIAMSDTRLSMPATGLMHFLKTATDSSKQSMPAANRSSRRK